MKSHTTILITIIAMLFLTAFSFNFILREKEEESFRNEMRILASLREDINKKMQTFSYKIDSALQEIKDIRTERIYLEEKTESVKKQINGIHSQLNNFSETRIKTIGIELPLIPCNTRLQDEKVLLKTEDSLERQNITEHFQKAVFYQKNGELTKAIQEYESILKIDTLNAEAHNNMGLLYQQKGEYNKALIAYRKAVLLKPDYNKARSNMGTALYRQERLKEASLEFESVLEKEPENVHALTNLAIIYKEEGNLEKAKDLLLKALDFDYEFPEAHYNLAIILEELGSIDEAIVHYCAFLKNSPDVYTSLKAGVLKRLEVIEKKPASGGQD